MKKRILLLFLFCTSLIVIAQQFFLVKKYPKGSFAAPVKIPVSLAGNFGECRANHFHSGLDVRTNKVENIPIYAIADGYVSRIKIENTGFGNAIYITHANGYTSLYAHLNLFYPELEKHVRTLQKKQKTWKIDFTMLPHEFPVYKGSFIAYSGNTGSSQAPHLHMEIRDAKTDKPLNGLLFYNLEDSKAPIVKKIALYDKSKSIYDQSPKQFNCIKKGSFYTIANDTIISNLSQLAFGIVADDPMENALGVLGVYEMNLFVDDQAYFGWQLDNIGYEETRYMNAMADYRVKKNGGSWIQLCYKSKGDKLGIYKSFNDKNGIINLLDNKAHAIKMIVKDANQNTSIVKFWIKGNANNNLNTNYAFKANVANTFNDGNIAFKLSEDALYDDIPFATSIKPNAANMYSHLYQVHYSDVPVHTYFDLKLKPKVAIPNSLKDKLAIVRYPYGKDIDKKGKLAHLDAAFVSASVRDFGTYEIVIDQSAPSLTCNLKNNTKLVANKIICTSKDAVTSVAQFIGKIDGQWVRFAQKGNTYTYDVDEYCGTGNHTLEITAIDENGNTAIQKIYFTK